MNPTTQVLEERLAALEGGAAALCVSSGSSAVALAIQNVAAAGDNIADTGHSGDRILPVAVTFHFVAFTSPHLCILPQIGAPVRGGLSLR